MAKSQSFQGPITSGENNNVNQFEALFNFATIGIVVTDQAGIIVNFNQYAESQFGFKKDEVLGKPVELLIPVPFQRSHTGFRQGFYKKPGPRRMGEGRDLQALRKDKSQFPVEISLSHYVINEKMYVIAFVIDITVRKKGEEVVIRQKEELEQITQKMRQLNIQLEEKVENRTQMLRETLSELEKSKDELSEALKSEKDAGELKSRFVTMASHEFRTPLSTILSSAFLLEKYNGGGSRELIDKHIQRIKNSVSAMKGILDDFLSLGKLEEGVIRASPQKFSPEQFSELIESVISDLDQSLKKGQKIVFIYENISPIFTDQSLFKNVLINLLSNAIKFSGENSEIELKCYSEKNQFCAQIKDQGMGIPAEDQRYLFTRFFRAGNSANVPGTGLGLHIVASYLELLSGTIDVESTLNVGTKFTIHLPESAL